MPVTPDNSEHLYASDDLANAAIRSQVGHSVRDTFHGVCNGAKILRSLVEHRLAGRTQDQIELFAATGNVYGVDTAVTAAYAGTGANRAWCFTSIFDQYSESRVGNVSSLDEVSPQFINLAAGANFVVGDGVDIRSVAPPGSNFLIVPSWIKQRLSIHTEWHSQIRGLRRGTRQEVSRTLRKFQYECRLTTQNCDFEDFYDNLYKPYATLRFSDGAILVDRDRFLAECRRGIVLQLISQDIVVGASLLRRVGNIMAIVWSALDPNINGRGASDVLDYFSLLYSSLKRCRWLDFGPSRPNLLDGVTRYKSKWGTEITAGFSRQPDISIACTGRHDAESRFLRRHAFIVQHSGQLIAVALFDGDSDMRAICSKVSGMIVAGIDQYRIVTVAGISGFVRSQIESIDPRVEVVEVASVGEAVAAVCR